ncbi:hypothetical protein H1R20_g13630, partial [Candolleomyces eurysporus]
MVDDDHPKDEPDFERVLGRIFAWICTTLYLTSRLPQIWKNYVRKSVEGLSMYLFVFAFLGNSFYVASILLSPKTYLPPPESTNFIRESIPYLLGSSGTLMFDITIVTQSFIYRPRPKRQHTTPRWPSSAAEAPEVLLQNVKRRSEIRELILAGEVDNAIDLLNKYFPSVLAESPSPSERPSSSNPEGSFTYVSATSVEAAHLLLNLRILAFIEACRTRPLEVPHPTKPPPEVVQSNAASQSDISTAMDTSEHSTLPLRELPAVEPGVRDIDPEVLDSLIYKGRKLYALVKALPNPKDREVYKQELKNVGGILAYKDPEESSVAKYLAYQRREAVADQINRAVLRE